MNRVPASTAARRTALSLVICAWATGARADLVAHWKFESDAPFNDSAARLHLNPEGKNTTGRKEFTATAAHPSQLKESESSLLSPGAKSIDLRLRVNAPTRGENPFRLMGTSWTLTGWFQHTGAEPSPFGHVIAGTHGHTLVIGRGFAGWCLRVVKGDGNERKLTALFSTGGEKPVTFELKGSDAIAVGDGQWNHFALVWQHDGGAAGKGEARLFVSGKPAAAAAAPETFDVAAADLNAFRGIWLAGRPTSQQEDGSDNWAGRLDEIKFHAGAMTADAILAESTGAGTDSTAVAVAKKPESPPPASPAVPMPVTPPPAPVATVEPPPPAPPKEPPPPAETVLEMRTWTDYRGQTMEAALVKSAAAVPERVLLQTADKIRISLPIEKISEADKAYVRGK